MTTEIVKTGGSLAIHAEQTMWSPEQTAVLRQSGIDGDVTNAELAGFLHLCQRTGLDPFSRQIYLIGRKDKRAGRVVFTPQTGIDGYRVIAQRVTAQTGGSYGYEDFLWCDGDGRWRDVWLSDTPPAASKVIVIRNGQKFSAVARFKEYAQAYPDGNLQGLWAKMPAGQIAKCAEALALRKAFPHDLAGVYTAEEMAQADNTATPHLRSVTTGEPDQWATAAPAPQAEAATPAEPHPAAQAIADQAAEAADRDRVKQLWALAKTGRVLSAPARAADTGEVGLLGDYLTRRGAELPEAPVDVEIAPDPPLDEHAAAEAELRAVARTVGLDDIDRDAYEALGTAIKDASATALRDFAAQIRPAA